MLGRIRLHEPPDPAPHVMLSSKLDEIINMLQTINEKLGITEKTRESETTGEEHD